MLNSRGEVKEYSLQNARKQETGALIKHFAELFDSMNGSFDNFHKIQEEEIYCWASIAKIEPEKTIKALYTEFSKRKIENLLLFPQLKTVNTLLIIEYLVDVLQKIYKLTSLWMRHFNPLGPFRKLFRKYKASLALAARPQRPVSIKSDVRVV